jgi:hypothetical protein
MATENYIKNALSFFAARKIYMFALAGLMSWTLPGITAAQVESDSSVMMHKAVMLDTTAGNALVRTALTEEAPVGGAQPYAVSAGISPVVYAVPAGSLPSSDQPASADAGDDEQTAVAERHETFQLPYALVLALVALIGLVPVSRRKH